MNWDRAVDLDRKYYLHPHVTLEEWEPFLIERTEGSFLYNSKSERFLDFASQLGCVNLGQRNEKIIENMKEALDKYGFLWERYITDYRAEVLDLLMEGLLSSDGWAGRVKFLSTGSEGIEMALAIAKLYTNRPMVVTREFAYHGWTDSSGQCTRVRRLGSMVNPKSGEMRVLPRSGANYLVAPPPFCFRCPLGHSYPGCKSQDGTLSCVQVTESLIRNEGVERVAAVITEIISASGTLAPPPEYHPQVREMTRRLGVLWIDDEIVCGFGRTGKWFGYQHYKDVQPDIMVIAKGLSSSAFPISAVVVSKEIGEFFENYRWWTTQTFSAHPLGMAAVAGNIREMIAMDLPKVVEASGTYLREGLDRIGREHDCVGTLEGRGLFYGFELVKDKDTMEPFVKEDRDDLYAGDISRFASSIVAEKCLEKGVLVQGSAPNSVRIMPNLTVTVDEMDMGISALDYALTALDKEI